LDLQKSGRIEGEVKRAVLIFGRGQDDPMKIVPKSRCAFLGLLVLGVFLAGCPKRVVPPPPIETPVVKNPVNMLLEAFSAAEKFQSRASIRFESVRQGERTNFLLNGSVFYEKPDKLRIIGYHPLGMELFDALYRNGKFFLLNTYEKKAYSGEVSEFEDLIEKAHVQILMDKPPGDLIPNRVRIGAEENKIRVDLRLKDITVNSSLPADAFRWFIPEGMKVMPLAQLLRGTS
jgi:outer membrane lipoprotein-sorting protein